MIVRAKLCVSQIVTTDYGSPTVSRKVRLDTVYDSSIPEDQRFQKATPSGHIELGIDNEAALEQFKVGKVFYVDFTEVK